MNEEQFGRIASRGLYITLAIIIVAIVLMFATGNAFTQLP